MCDALRLAIADGPDDGDDIEADDAIFESVATDDLGGERRELVAFAGVDVGLGRGVLAAGRLNLYNDDAAIAWVLGQQVDLAEACAEVASEQAIARPFKQLRRRPLAALPEIAAGSTGTTGSQASPTMFKPPDH